MAENNQLDVCYENTSFIPDNKMYENLHSNDAEMENEHYEILSETRENVQEREMHQALMIKNKEKPVNKTKKKMANKENKDLSEKVDEQYESLADANREGPSGEEEQQYVGLVKDSGNENQKYVNVITPIVAEEENIYYTNVPNNNNTEKDTTMKPQNGKANLSHGYQNVSKTTFAEETDIYYTDLQATLHTNSLKNNQRKAINNHKPINKANKKRINKDEKGNEQYEGLSDATREGPSGNNKEEQYAGLVKDTSVGKVNQNYVNVSIPAIAEERDIYYTDVPNNNNTESDTTMNPQNGKTKSPYGYQNVSKTGLVKDTSVGEVNQNYVNVSTPAIAEEGDIYYTDVPNNNDTATVKRMNLQNGKAKLHGYQNVSNTTLVEETDIYNSDVSATTMAEGQAQQYESLSQSTFKVEEGEHNKDLSDRTNAGGQVHTKPEPLSISPVQTITENQSIDTAVTGKAQRKGKTNDVDLSEINIDIETGAVAYHQYEDIPETTDEMNEQIKYNPSKEPTAENSRAEVHIELEGMDSAQKGARPKLEKKDNGDISSSTSVQQAIIQYEELTKNEEHFGKKEENKHKTSKNKRKYKVCKVNQANNADKARAGKADKASKADKLARSQLDVIEKNLPANFNTSKNQKSRKCCKLLFGMLGAIMITLFILCLVYYFTKDNEDDSLTTTNSDVSTVTSGIPVTSKHPTFTSDKPRFTRPYSRQVINQ